MRLVALVMLAACSSTPSDHTAPEWFRGAWKLEWAKDKAGPPALTRWVRDLQTPTVFGSVRIDFDRPAIAAKSFAELTDAELEALLRQRGGFSGTASFTNDVATWTHELDFRPISPDIAHLKRLGPTQVLEEGTDGDFSELWWKMSSGDGKYLGIKIARAGRIERILTVVGDHFVLARNRAKDLPPGDSLPVIAAAMTRAQKIELADCEFSYGLVHGGRMPWEIRHSTLPWHEGTSLDFAREIIVDASGTLARRTPSADTWTVAANTFTREDLLILFP